MKIYILNVDKAFRPQKAPFKYPRHNIGWGGGRTDVLSMDH